MECSSGNETRVKCSVSPPKSDLSKRSLVGGGSRCELMEPTRHTLGITAIVVAVYGLEHQQERCGGM